MGVSMTTRLVLTLSVVVLLIASSEAIFPLPFLPLLPWFRFPGRGNPIETNPGKTPTPTPTTPTPTPTPPAGEKRSKSGDVVAQTNWPGKWELFVKNSGVSAMHAILMPVINKVQIYDATIWRVSGMKLPPGMQCHVIDAKTKKEDCWAHSVLLDVETGAMKPLLLNTDTWCSSGGLSVNGTLVSTGGFGGGANTARYLRDCENCPWVEYPKALASRRWYSTQAALPDGSFIVVGGRDAQNYEYIPPEGVINTKLYDSALLRETTDKEENNLYPFVWLNTDGNLFIFANDRSILLSPKTNQVIKEFPRLPGGARNYPGAASSALLPIRLYLVNPKIIPAEVLICGGAKKDAYYKAGKKIFEPALQDCARMNINSQNPVWKTEMMPTPRVMGDSVILPTGDILFVNGAKSGCSGWEYGKDPILKPLLYMPRLRRGQRFKELAPSTIPRMYHSTAIALPDGKVLVGGSNTNNGYKYDAEYPTELRIEKFSPPYLDPALANQRPRIVANGSPKHVRFGQKFSVRIQLNQTKFHKNEVRLTMLAPSFTTHSISMNMRMVLLGVSNVAHNVSPNVHEIQTLAPPSGNIAPPGYYLLFAVYKGVPSVGEWIQVV
ncbi:PREDICTED: aldehyde oxidase GLOX1-like [Tarenaya hassleriana]|uniref:aldehyde oxidase GLOX1-like n=1 Tax=Tarenaya hassleriana TaxID=28532 RepID=UPI00053C2DF4|nr:PREDICTED: aldehyde oxidase GLOX1-like [Tarenaya hassleriana]